MAQLNYRQACDLLELIASAEPDGLDCDGCYAVIAEFAEAERNGLPLDDALQPVRRHLEQCRCCAYEYEALLEALAAAEDL